MSIRFSTAIILFLTTTGIMLPQQLMLPSEAVPSVQKTKADIPDWKRLQGKGVELWLPSSFEGGNIDEDFDAIVAKVRTLGPDFVQLAKFLEQNRSLLIFYAIDSQSARTNVNIAKERVSSTTSMATYIDQASALLPKPFRVLEKKLIKLKNYEAGRILTEFSISDVQGRQAIYTIRDGDTMWAIAYTCSKADFAKYLPIFQQSIETFRVLPSGN